MLIKFSSLLKRHNINPVGVLHVGANLAQEIEEYYSCGIKRSIWIEADPALMDKLNAIVSKYPDAKAFNATAHMLDDVDLMLKITDNNSESSSIFRMGTHSQKHPDVHVISETPVKTKRIDNLLVKNQIVFEGYDFLNIDVQGAELYVLKGIGKSNLEKIKYAYIEVNNEELYIGCALSRDIDNYMEKSGFVKVDECMTDNNWGDAFYIRKELVSSGIPGWNETLTDQAIGRIDRGNAKEKPLVIDFLSAEQMAFARIAKELSLNIRGIINAGAYTGNDWLQYNQLGIQNVMMLEPNPEPFEVLRLNHSMHASVHNVALSENNGNQNIYLTHGDSGKSNSILYPTSLFYKQYPDIKFDGGNLSVLCKNLDNIGVDVGRYNMLHIDVNGYELQALRGCVTFLHHCSYVYTKVQYAKLYENSFLFQDIKAFLQHFNFGVAMASNEGQTWGYALFIKKDDPAFPKEKAKQKVYADASPQDLKNEYLDAIPVNKFVENVPAIFRPHIKKPLPIDNVIPFEEWYYASYSFDNNAEGLVYLPVFWNSYYSNNDAESKNAYVQELQNYLETIDKKKSYYTICMYHKGILNDLSGLKVKVIGVNEKCDFVIPPVCQPHQFDFGDIEKDIFLSYLGPSLHPLRRQIFEKIPNNKYLFISNENMPLEEYCKVLARSKYVLCPEGFKKTNYRAAEAFQYGAIPIELKSDVAKNNGVYLYRQATVDDYSLIITSIEEKLGGFHLLIDGTLKSVSKEYALQHYKSYLQYESVKNNCLIPYLKDPENVVKEFEKVFG